MTIQNIEDTLVQGIASILSKDKSSIAADVPLHELGIDSLALTEILVFIEQTFKLKLIESGLYMRDFETIQSLASLIHKKL